MKKYNFEWRYTDDETIRKIYEFFCENPNEYGGGTCSVSWSRGVYNEENTLFLTQISSVSGWVMQTGTDADTWFYIGCVVFVKTEEGSFVAGTASYKTRGRDELSGIYVSKNLIEYFDIISAAIQYRESHDMEDTITEELSQVQREKINRYIDELRKKDS